MSIETIPRITLTAGVVDRQIDDHLPSLHAGGRSIHSESVAHRIACCPLASSGQSIRLGRTRAGVTIFVAPFGPLGSTAIPAARRDLNINFALRPVIAGTAAEARIIRPADDPPSPRVRLSAQGSPGTLAHSIGGYAGWVCEV